MNIANHRASFNVQLLSSEPSDSVEIENLLSEIGYQVTSLGDSERFAEQLAENPPHILLLHRGDEMFGNDEFIRSILKISPETRIVILFEDKDRESAMKSYALGVYDCVALPLSSDWQLIRALDRAAERDYYMYMNEQLTEKMQSQEGEPSSSPALLEVWLKQLQAVTSIHQAQECFTAEVGRHLKHQVLFFKYLPIHHSLVLSQSYGVKLDQFRGVGVDLLQENPHFIAENLATPENLKGLQPLINKAFGSSQFWAQGLRVGGEWLGVCVYLKPSNVALDFISPLEDAHVKMCTQSLLQTIRILQLEKSLHSQSICDEPTQVLNRPHFLVRLNEELTRSRRTRLPVALILASVDNFDNFVKNRGETEANLFLKMLASIFKKSSRVNDLVGRLSDSEFGLILPHTGKTGAAIKAERLRRMVERADFSKVLSRAPQFTLSLGVSEYPTHCHDADDILQVADQALFEVKKIGHNKVCLAQAPEGFVPDFTVG
jgi:diguanylate cyclase (GGDEF)-like protein